MKMNKYIKSLLFSATLWYFGEGMMGPLLAFFAQKVGGNLLEITWAWASFLIVSGVFYIIVGKFVDLKGNKELVMVIGYGLNAVFTFCYLFVSSPWHLIAVEAGLGFATALATPTWNALFSKYTDKDNDGFQWGIYGGLEKITTAASILIGGIVVNYLSFNLLFIIMGTIQLLATVVQIPFLLEKKTK